MPDSTAPGTNMDLTPIRIRGKPNTKPKRRIQDGPISASQPQTKRRRREKPRVHAAMPTLQGLPQELLEIIFLYSMNISLPRASPDLGRKLSHRYICIKYTMRTFMDIEHADTSTFHAQSELMKSRFFTWPFFLSYVKAAHDVLVTQRPKWHTVGVPDVSCFTPLWPFRFTQLRYLGFAGQFYIPEKLLHGPWTRDKASLLYVLVAFNGEINWSGSVAGETAKAGLQEAVKEGNELAVAALSVLLGIQRMIGTEVLRSAVMECGCDVNIVRHLVYNAQILHRGHQDKAMLDFHDPLLWRWAEQAEERDDPKGTIVKTMMKEADRFAFDFYFEDETDFTKIVPFPYSGDKFNPRGGFDPLKREMLTRLYLNHGRKITLQPREGSLDLPAQADN
jgi:hypothetical protein